MFIVAQMYKNSHNYFSLTIHLVRFVVRCVLYNAWSTCSHWKEFLNAFLKRKSWIWKRVVFSSSCERSRPKWYTLCHACSYHLGNNNIFPNVRWKFATTKDLGHFDCCCSFFVVNFNNLKVKISIRKIKIVTFYISGRPVTWHDIRINVGDFPKNATLGFMLHEKVWRDEPLGKLFFLNHPFLEWVRRPCNWVSMFLKYNY